MDKKTELKFCKEVIAWLGIGRDELEAQLAEAEKSELRHGDYGVWNTGQFWLALYRNRVLEAFGSCSGAGMKVSAMPREQFIILGNIFADLKAMKEDLTEFCRKDLNGKQGCGTNAFAFAINGSRIEYRGHNFACLGLEEISKLILNLRRMEATLKRKKNG